MLVPDMLAGVGFDYIPTETSNVVRLTQKRENLHHVSHKNKHLPKEVGAGGGGGGEGCYLTKLGSL